MLFTSTSINNTLATFKDAILGCLPPQGGLYVPASVADMRHFFLYMEENISYQDLAASAAAALLQGELNPYAAAWVAESAFTFTPSLKKLDDNLSLLDLTGGPTGNYKDFGLSFLAAVMEEMLKTSGPVMVISAAGRDAGASIANAFLGRQGITNVILYPKASGAPLRGIREDMLKGCTSAGPKPIKGNVIPIEVDGTLGDCYRLIDEMINDRRFSSRYRATSANTINPGRLLPQSFYYLYAFIRLKKDLNDGLVFSVPCGSLGNLVSGLAAWQFGMPITMLLAAQNANNPLRGVFDGTDAGTRRPVSTLSPAMDITMPANYDRLTWTRVGKGKGKEVMKNLVKEAVVSDDETMAAIKEAWEKYRILIDPHTAVAWAAVKKAQGLPEKAHTVVIATGHPAFHAALVEKITGQKVELPAQIAALGQGGRPIAVISPELSALEAAIAAAY
jgi:threonine synthase